MTTTPKQYLDAIQAFWSGKEMSPEELELCRTASVAGCFAAQAYETGMAGGHDIHVLTTAFLQALIDPSHPSLDHLRADPESGPVAREATERLNEIAKDARP